MIKLTDLLLENDEAPVALTVQTNKHETVTVKEQTFFVSNLRRDVINVELKMVNGVAFVTVK